jgi:hypothetical protein
VPPVLVPADAPELRLVHEWLDNWSGIGLIIAGMTHQGFTVSLGEHGWAPGCPSASARRVDILWLPER